MDALKLQNRAQQLLSKSTLEMSTEEWLVARQAGIGGSDASAVLGLNPFKSPLAVYNEKMDPNPQPTEPNDKMRWGNILETPIAEHYAELNNVKIRRVNKILQHKKEPWMLGNLDRIITRPDGNTGVLEVKTAGGFYARTWETEVPTYYYVQCQHYLAVTGYQWADIAVLIDGHDFRTHLVVRDEEFIEMMIENMRDFWEGNVLAGKEPEPTTAEDIKNLFPHATDGATAIATPQIADVHKALVEAKRRSKEAAEEVKAHEAQIKAFMGDADTCLLDGHTLATWKNVNSNRFDSKAFAVDHPELYAEYKRASQSRRFLVK